MEEATRFYIVEREREREREIKASLIWFQTVRDKKFQEIAKYSYDAENLRTRAIEEIEQGVEREFYDVLHLYNEVSFVFIQFFLLPTATVIKCLFSSPEFRVCYCDRSMSAVCP